MPRMTRSKSPQRVIAPNLIESSVSSETFPLNAAIGLGIGVPLKLAAVRRERKLIKTVTKMARKRLDKP